MLLGLFDENSGFHKQDNLELIIGIVQPIRAPYGVLFLWKGEGSNG